MRNQRGKQYDWSKSFKLIHSKKQFDCIQTNDNDLLIIVNGEDTKKSTHQDKKQQIIVPKIQTVRRITNVKKFAGVPLYYNHINKNLTLPKLYHYELTEVDHIFVNAHQGKFKLASKNALTTQFLQRAFIQMETKAGKDPVLPRNKTWMTNFVERQYKDLTKMTNYEDFTEVVYNYWRNRRQQLKFPLLRPLWRANADQYNHLLAFKVRQKQKRNLRRVNRIADEEISIQLGDQFQNMLKICQRIKMRQQLKLKMVKLNILNFHTECNSISSKSQITQFIQQFKKQPWQQTISKDKEKIKNLQMELQIFRKRRQTYEEQQEEQQPTINAIFDQRLTVVNFISTVSTFAQQFGINYDIFQPTISSSSSTTLQKTADTRVTTNNFKIQQTTTNISQDQPVDKHEIFNFQLKSCEDLLIRKLDAIQNSNVKNVATNFIQFRKRNICQWYFGEDDEGDNKELKKNISASFKKFLQISKAHQ